MRRMKFVAAASRRILWALPLAILTVISAQACTESVSLVKVALVRFTTPSTPNYVLRLSQDLQSVVEMLDSNGQPLSGREITYSSSNSSVASVNSIGVISANSVGQATIQAESGGIRGSVVIQVTLVQVSSVGVSPAPLTVMEFETQQAVVTPRDSADNVLTVVGRNVAWTTNTPSVASLSAASGNTVTVTGVTRGTAMVTVFVDGVPSSGVAVTVTPQPVVSVDVTPSTPSLAAGTAVALNATPRDIHGHALAGRTITWSSSDLVIATVAANGQVKGLTAGQATITALCEGIVGTALVTVR